MVHESVLYRSYTSVTKIELILAGIIVGAMLWFSIMSILKRTIIWVPLLIIFFILAFTRPLSKAKRTKIFKAKIESFNLIPNDLDILISLVKSKSNKVSHLPAKVFGVLAALAFPAYNWLLQELLKSYLMGTIGGKYIAFLLSIALVIVFLGFFIQNVIERLSIDHQYMEIANILEVIRIDSFLKKITEGNNNLVRTPS